MRRGVELRPGAFGDPEGTRAAAVLAAYFHLEEVRDFRRLLMRQAALVCLSALLAAALMPGAFRAVIEGAFGAAAAVGIGASIVEYRAMSRLRALIHDRQA